MREISIEAIDAYTDIAKSMAKSSENSERQPKTIPAPSNDLLPVEYYPIKPGSSEINSTRTSKTDPRTGITTSFIQVGCPLGFGSNDRAVQQIFGCLIHEWMHELQEREDPDAVRLARNISNSRNPRSADPEHHWSHYYSLPVEQEAHGAQSAAEMIFQEVQQWNENSFLTTLGWIRSVANLQGNPGYYGLWKMAIIQYAKHHFDLLRKL